MITSTVTGARTRSVVWIVVALVVFVSLIDLGSVVLTKLRVDDDVKSAGFAGATAITNQPVDSRAAQTAYGAATGQLNEGESIVQQTFVVQPDGGVTLTMRKQAPTVFFKHLSFLDGFTHVEDTYEQSRIGY